MIRPKTRLGLDGVPSPFVQPNTGGRLQNPALACALAIAIAGCTAEEPPKPDTRFWGRLAYVPDWHAAERIDAAATARFLSDHWPALHPTYLASQNALPDAGVTNTDPTVFVTRLDQPILPDYLPSDTEQATRTVSLFAARGESEAFSLGLRSGNLPATAQLQVSALENARSSIPAGAVSQRLVLTYPARRHARATQDDQVMKPMVMIRPDASGWRFPPHTSHNYIIDIHVPADAEAGTYRGTVTVRIDGKVADTVAIQLRVLPFQLRVNNFHAGAFGVTYNQWEGGFTGYHPEMMEMDSRYGLNMAGGFFNKGKEIPFRRDAAGQLVVDTAHPKFNRFNQTMQRLRDYGMGDVAFWNWGASGKVAQFNDVLAAAGFPGIETEAGKQGFAEICRAIKHAEVDYGWPELVINPYDEALDDQDATRHVIEAVRYVQALSPDTRLYMTEWHEHYARLYQSSGKTLGGLGRPRTKEYLLLRLSLEAPRLNFAVIGSNRALPDSRALQDQLGGEYWHYGAATGVGPWARLVYGLQPYSARAEAALLWANYKGELSGEGWTLHYVLSEKHRRGVRSEVAQPIHALPSPRALLAREGIDDRKYIETLRFFAHSLRSQEDLEYLAQLPDLIRRGINAKRAGGRSNREGVSRDEALADTLRASLAERITSLLARQYGNLQNARGET